MTRTLDFSGAPPLLIPRRLVTRWGGAINEKTGEYFALNTNAPRTDYDRACQATWPGRGVLPVGDGSALVLYTEFDEHAWDNDQLLVCCGGWLPTREEVKGAGWSEPLVWESDEADYLLMNSAASGAAGLRKDDFLEVRLMHGRYVIEWAYLAAEYVGCFHRFTPTD